MTLPQWTSRFTDEDVGGEDHLGLEGAAQSYQQYLIPGIITTTDHARYYSFYCWVLYRYIHDPDSSRLLADFRGPYFRRHEVAFILGCYSHHMNTGGIPGLVGSGNGNSKARGMWENDDLVSLDVEYFGNRLGGFGQYYRTAMEVMGLVAPAERPRWVYRLTQRGKALAEAFEGSIKHTEYVKALNYWSQLTSLGHDAASEYGESCCLCPQALSKGTDREPLIDAFFRFDHQEDARQTHVRRRLTLGLILDLVAKSSSVSLRKSIRPALYLGEYDVGHCYEPDSSLRAWYSRWRLVQLRHTYTFALQVLWAAFLDHLRENQEVGLTFPEFMDWAAEHVPDGCAGMPVSAYLDRLCATVGLDGDWAQAHHLFDNACKQQSGCDEYCLYLDILGSRRDPGVLIANGLQILCQLFLRFCALHQAEDPVWQELARQPRLPISGFFHDLFHHERMSKWTVRDLLEWVYREYILGQHEFIALQKLRYQEYDTFKFRYQGGVFSWPHGSEYSEPIRFPTLRLLNGLTILTDMGLVVEDQDGTCSLTHDGRVLLKRVVEASHVG